MVSGGVMYKKCVLDNGVRIVYERIPYVRSVSVGIWVKTGSRNENTDNNGISHFIEHMMFKGTKTRTAKQIAESFDNIGGQLNAFTGKECTCYYAKTLDSHIDIALEVLSDMFFNSKFDNRDIKIEKRVVLEEIGMYEDSPEELVHDILSDTVWGNSTIGYPILGTQKSLEAITRQKIVQYMKENYTPANVVISIAGNFDEDHIINSVRNYFGSWSSEKNEVNRFDNAVFTPNIGIKVKDTEQVHMCIGFEGIEHGNDKLYTLLAINNIFGGGMSSRLFQKIREEKGLVYSIYSYPSSYENSGLYTIYAGMNPEQLTEVIKIIMDEINTIKSRYLSQEELDRSKEQLKGSYILGLESTSSRMNSIGKSELLLGRINTPEEVLKKIDNINMDNVIDVIDSVFTLDKIGFSAVGSIKDDFDFKKLIK